MAERYAAYKKGEVSITEGQKKKHYSQCTNDELAFIAILVKSIGSIKLSKHAKEKTDITINLNEIKHIIKSNDIADMLIEYSVSKDDKRVLLRAPEKMQTIVDGKITYSNMCFVLSLITKEVITVWYNSANDHHDTLNFKRYNKKLKIL